jgi:hypothetical protein
MAVKRKNHSGGQLQKGQFKLDLVASYEQSFPSFYSNYAAVSNTPTELCIDFCVLAPPHRVNVEKKTAGVPVIARVLIPADMASGLVKALESQIQRHKEAKSANIIALEGKKQ